MIKTWNEFCAQIEASDAKLTEFIAEAGLSALQIKKLQKFTCDWNKMKKMAEQFDQFVCPLDPIKVESPFDQEDFRYIWKMWKEYLSEQHAILVRTRMEQASLDYLSDISENNVDRAINIIRICMKNRWKAIYPPNNTTTAESGIDDLRKKNEF